MPTNDKPETLTGEQNAGVTIESYAGGPCWIVRDATGVKSLLTADRTSAELRAERLRIMGGRWKTAEQLCDMIMEQRRREQPTQRERLDAAMMKSLCRDDAAAEIATAGLARVRDELRAAEELGATWKRQHGEAARQLSELRNSGLIQAARRALEYAPNEVEANVLRAALAKAEGGAK